jgi:uncharacterized membrane protein YfcA
MILDQPMLLLVVAMFFMATLYSTVGHGGGSGYLAVMALAGFVPEEMRPTALTLNIVVASIATWKFSSAKSFRRDIFVPLVVASIPAAFFGGLVEIPATVYKPVVGAILLCAAVRLFVPVRGNEQSKTPHIFVTILAGVVIGFGSGLIGIGGGIFLSPLVLLLGWATAKQTAAISAPFILVNSVSALGGIAISEQGPGIDLHTIPPLVVAVVIGGVVGATFGSRRLGSSGLRRVLGIVLMVAALKMFLTMMNNPSPKGIQPPVDVKFVS